MTKQKTHKKINLIKIITDFYQNQNWAVINFVIYLLIFFVIISNFNIFQSQFDNKDSIKIIREGMILPKVDGVDYLFNVDPLLTSSQDSFVVEIKKKISKLTFSSLFIENTQGTLDNDLVESYEFKNSSELNLKIKDNVFWSNGQKLTTKDIEFTLNTIRSLGSKSLYYGASNSNNIEIQIISDSELKINLIKDNKNMPNSSYLYELVFPIIPQSYFEEKKYTKSEMDNISITSFGIEPVTSGIFRYSNNKRKELELSINENYYGSKASVDKYILKFFNDFAELKDAFILRNIDLFIRSENVHDDNHNTLVNTSLKFQESILRNRRLALYFNMNSNTETSGIFNKLVTPRRSLAHVLVRTKISEYLDQTKIREIYGPIDQDSWAFWNDVTNMNNYDVAAFTKTVENLGYTRTDNNFYKKDDQNLSLKITFLDTELNKRIAESIKNQFAEVGIEVILDGLNNNINNGDIASRTFNSVVNNRSYDVLLTAIDKNLDPDVYTEWSSKSIATPGLNFSGFNSKVIDNTLTEGRIASKQDDRKSQYIKFQTAFYNESAPAIYLFNPSAVIYFRNNVDINVDDHINNVDSIYNNISSWKLN